MTLDGQNVENNSWRRSIISKMSDTKDNVEDNIHRLI